MPAWPTRESIYVDLPVRTDTTLSPERDATVQQLSHLVCRTNCRPLDFLEKDPESLPGAIEHRQE